MKKSFFALLTTLLTIYSLSARAQITDPVDPLRPSLPDTTQTVVQDSLSVGSADQGEDEVDMADPDSVTYRIKLTADGTANSGNVNRILLQLTGALEYELSRQFKLSTNPSFIYGRQNGMLNEREWFGDLRTTFKYDNRLYYLAFGSMERSNLRQIALRFTAAGGAGYKLINKASAYLSITDVLLYENTNFIELNDIKVLRNSARIYGEYFMGKDKRWSISHTAFYQPALNQKGNVRWNASLSVQVRVTSAVSLRTTAFNSYESIISPGRKNNDFRWTMGLVYEKK